MTTLNRARNARRLLRRDLEALRQEARPVEFRRLLPAGWHPAKAGLTWGEWLDQLDEATTFNGHPLTPNTVQRMTEEADRNEAEAKRDGTYREPRRMSDEQWERQCAVWGEQQLARQRGL